MILHLLNIAEILRKLMMKFNMFLSLTQATNENLPPNVIKQLAKELKNLDETPPEGIKVGVNDDDFTTIFADIDGPGLFPFSLFRTYEHLERILLQYWS